MDDLFDKRTKKDELLDFIRSKKWCRTSEIIQWGSAHFYNRAERTARDLANEGFIKRMDEYQKNYYFNFTKEDVWEVVNG